jgi:hypothetical protein
MQMTRPREPCARAAFLETRVILLRQEIEQPPGDGAVFRIARALLRTGQFQKAGEYIVNEGTRNLRRFERQRLARGSDTDLQWHPAVPVNRAQKIESLRVGRQTNPDSLLAGRMDLDAAAPQDGAP